MACVVVDEMYGSLSFFLLLLLLAIVLYGVNLGPRALVAAVEQQMFVHLVTLLGYLVKILLLLIQVDCPRRLYLVRELVDEEILDDVKVWVSIRREQTLLLVGERGHCFSFTHSDVHQLGESVVLAHVVDLSESLDHRCVGSPNLLATYSISLLP